MWVWTIWGHYRSKIYRDLEYWGGGHYHIATLGYWKISSPVVLKQLEKYRRNKAWKTSENYVPYYSCHVNGNL